MGQEHGQEQGEAMEGDKEEVEEEDGKVEAVEV